MPNYDFKCHLCHTGFSLTYKSFSVYAQTKEHVCPNCNSHKTKRTIGRVAVAQSQTSRLDRLADSSLLDSIDENDPQAANRFMQKLSKELDSSGEEISNLADQMQKQSKKDS